MPMKTQEFDRSALGWVRKELDEILNQAAQALQEYSEEPDDRTRLRFCATYLHQVYGTLQMLELYGVSMLGEEMEQLIEAMLADSVADAREAQEALMTAILRTSELLERIQAGQNDSSLAVLPLVNDLRAARGQKLLSEGTLFFTNPGSPDGPRRSRDAGADLAAVAKARRPHYQKGLLALLRGSATRSNINELLTTLDQLDEASTDDRSGDLWWVTAGVIEGLIEEGAKPGLSLQGLLREVDQQMRKVIREGEQALIDEPPSELFSNLLYYSSQAGSGTERLQAIHERFHLEKLVSESESLSGQAYAPGADILESVATAIREDTTGVKDSLDLFVRSGQKDAGRLVEAGASLQRVADTLGMLGLGASRSVVRDQVELVERLAAGGEADEQQLIELAKSLLYVESSLEVLVSGGATATNSEGQDGSSTEEPDADKFLDMEYRSVYRTTVREAVVDISAVKDAIVRFIEREDHSALDEMAPLAHRLQGALEIIGLDRAGGLVRDISIYLRDQVIAPRQVPDSSSLDALADAVISLEYYLEAVLDNRPGQAGILEVAERSTAHLGSLSASVAVAKVADGGTADEPTTLDAASLPTESEDDRQEDAVPAEPEAPAPSRAEASPPSAPPARTGASGGVNHGVAVKADEIDEEILEIFLEEVDEVLETAGEVYPLWRKNLEDSSSLATLRRMFHTLKGSGRMAGALLIGELGWSVERLLNRIIDGHVEPNTEVLDTIKSTMDVVPELARELVDGTQPKADVRSIMRQADRLADPQRYAELADVTARDVAEEADVSSNGGVDQATAPEAIADWIVGTNRESSAPLSTEIVDADAAGDLDFELDEDISSITADQPVAGQDQAAEPMDEELPELDLLEPSSEGLEERVDPEESAASGLTEEERPESDANQYLELTSEFGSSSDDAAAVSELPPELEASEIDEAELDAFFAEFEAQVKKQPASVEATERPSGDGVPVSDAEIPVQAETTDTEGDDTSPEPAMDPALYEIFSIETDDHLSVVRSFIEECRAGDKQGGVTEELTRALHTLTGSARMADVQPVARLGRKLEELVGQRQEYGQSLNDGDLGLLESGVERVNDIVHALGDASRALPGVEDLMEGIEEYRRRHVVPTSGATMDEIEEPADEDVLDEQSAEVTPVATTPESDKLADEDAIDEQPVEAAAPVASSAPEFEELSVEEALGKELAEASPTASEPEDESPESPELTEQEQVTSSGGADIDSELVSLFLEEAEDILQFLESSTAGWEDGNGVEARITELVRSLHTLKGGARLAHFDHIGDLCHSLESLISDVDAGRIPADDQFFDLLHDVMERLGDMVARAGEGKPASYSKDLHDAIAGMRSGSSAPVEVPEPAALPQPATEPESPDVSVEPAPDQANQGYESELTEVFLEEAEEILQAIESAQHAWADEPGDSAQLIEIERALHTLKGGARMAGFAPIATLSHAVETLLSGVRGGSVSTDEQLFELLDLAHDRLHLMRERAAGALSLEDAADLLAQLEAFRKGEAPPGDSAPEVSADTAPREDAAPVTPPVEVDKGEGMQDEPVKPAPASPREQEDAGPAGEHADVASRSQSDQIRVRADLLDNLVNFAGEVSIYRARLDQQVGAFRFNLTELDQTVIRLREQLRTLEIETETQILYRHERENERDDKGGDFDPLELDRFSRMQELSRALSESVSDLGSIQGLLDNLARESETLLLQQSRVNTELQDGLMRTRMVPFANLAPRLRRIVRQTAQELGRKAQVTIQGAQGEMDRTVLERVTAPLEHMLRNAVAHGIEEREARLTAGKSETGQITVSLDREGADVVLRVRDDGAGLNLEAIRRKARDRGLLRNDVEPTDREIMQFVLEQGFSTADTVTQIAGRGVGMDVVNSEIKQLGGVLEIDSTPGQGTRFTVRLPFTLAMNQALLCTAGEQVYAIPLTSIEGVVRLTRDELDGYLVQGDKGRYRYGDQDYRVVSLLDLLGTGEPGPVGTDKRVPVVLVQTSDHCMAIQVDSLLGNREIVVKSVGPQISTVPGIFGATILADGRVVLILDVSSLARIGAANGPHTGLEHAERGGNSYPAGGQPGAGSYPLVMVVDDSITMRKVAARLLERNNYQVITAKDGVDAVAKLQDHLPDAMLLDIEMPRMDGYEVATHMRNDARLQEVPIIMITSRTGEKHSRKAMEIGVNRYMGKPYQEHELLANLLELLGEDHVRQ